MNAPECFADRLLRAMHEKGAPVCVGIDPLVERLPRALITEFSLDRPHRLAARAGAVQAFGAQIIRVVAPHVAAVKINIAFFEPLLAEGIRAYYALVAEARRAGLLVIGDVKRADIGHSSTQYAAAHLRPLSSMSRESGADDAVGKRHSSPIGIIDDPTLKEWETPDAVTLNPYLGRDAVDPFIVEALAAGRGTFVLVQTSNDSAGTVQSAPMNSGRPFVEHIASLVNDWAGNPGMLGTSGFSAVGAVVSPSDPAGAARLRRIMPRSIFLIPGYGAQGKDAQAIAACFDTAGRGAIVNASRSVIYAYEDVRNRPQAGGSWVAAVEQACRAFVREINHALAAP